MAKSVKKKNLKLKRRIRKTAGALFLISALLVAAIPVENLQADTQTDVMAAAYTKPEYTLTQEESAVPLVSADETIYSTSDGKFQFAYVNHKGDTGNAQKIGVILGYSSSGSLGNGTLTIPDTVDIYKKYTDNLGSNDGYVAVGRSGNALFYGIEENMIDENGNIVYNTKMEQVISGGDVYYQEVPDLENPKKVTKVYPCYYKDIDKWGDLELEEFYYVEDEDEFQDVTDKTNVSHYVQTTSSEYQLVKEIDVCYIGNQSLEEDEDGNIYAGAWLDPATILAGNGYGVFTKNGGNIQNLIISSNLMGIGDFAFYDCTNLYSVSFGDGLNAIGNYSFANCSNLKEVTMPANSNLTALGDHAFYNCQSLKAFSVPNRIQEFGDFCFGNCFALSDLNLTGVDDDVVALKTLGNYCFVNCRSLKEVVFPHSINRANNSVVDVTMFEGCTNLTRMAFWDNTVGVTVSGKPSYNDSTVIQYTYNHFKEDVHDEFYFEGAYVSEIHTISQANAFAFKYIDDDGNDVYEMVLMENGKKATFRVDSNNRLIYCDVENGFKNVEIPGNIGPKKVQEINSSGFKDNCFIEKIVIPATIRSIAEDAFKGCHSLQHVIFEDASTILSIGANAFQTQDATIHKAGCAGTLSADPFLSFTGLVSNKSQPFLYAMDPSSKINRGSQKESFITYYTGWPQNLVIQYNPDTDSNELIEYPTLSTLQSNYYTNAAKYPYLTEDWKKAARDAAEVYDTQSSSLTSDQKDLIDSTINIVIPEGVESIKKNLIKESEAGEIAGGYGDVLKTVETNGVKEIGEGMFEGWTSLAAITINGATSKIDDYAFKDCTNLTEVTISPEVIEMGKRPFIGCSNLENIDFSGSPYFMCQNQVVYSMDGGYKDGIVQVLECRGVTVGSTSLESAEVGPLTKLWEEAFMDCKGVGSVDLRNTTIAAVPDSCFENTEELYSVYLPHTCDSIGNDAFKNSGVQMVQIPSYYCLIQPSSFNTVENSGAGTDRPEYNRITFSCQEGSSAQIYADRYDNINYTTEDIKNTFTVYFWGKDGEVLDKQYVIEGEDAVPPQAPEIEGYTFTGWAPAYTAISRDLDVVAQYEAIDPDSLKHTVTFIDWDDTVIKEVLVADGGDAEAPANPTREGYSFTGWRPEITNITEDVKVYAQYSDSKYTVRFIDWDDKVLSTQLVNEGAAAVVPASPTRAGYTFDSWRPSDLSNITANTDVYATYIQADSSSGNGNGNGGNGSGSGSGNGSGDDTDDNKNKDFYTLTVKNGSGSGSYIEGEEVIIIANDPASGQAFNKWTVEPSDVKIASANVSATVITMPSKDVTVTASYKKIAGSGSGSGTGNTSGSNNGSGNITGGNISSNGSTVVIDKNGLSNTGVVSVKVNGSSDNFTIKITESAYAKEQAVKALLAEYGDLTNIVYFPMDISLYDSTGEKLITDTTGLSISITLPLPDSLIGYAGNNKVASVTDGTLEKLGAKFTTIDGVSCITFTAEHFSPYVIYVNKANLSAGTVNDDTPKTGDGIHPKWFLSIGLLCMAMILFLKKDKVAVPVKVASAR